MGPFQYCLTPDSLFGYLYGLWFMVQGYTVKDTNTIQSLTGRPSAPEFNFLSQETIAESKRTVGSFQAVNFFKVNLLNMDIFKMFFHTFHNGS